MREKLIRNTSDERWRLYWEAVDLAASKATVLRFEDKTPKGGKRVKATKKRAKSKKGR